MSLTNLIFIVLIIVIVIVFATSGKLQALVKAFFNLFVEDLAATPEGAEALFNQKEEEMDEKFRKADNVYKTIAGKKKRCETELESLKAKFSTIESQCERLAKAGDEEGLDIKLQERTDVKEEIEIHEETLTKLKTALKDAFEARAACDEALKDVQKKRKQTVSRMKHNRDMKEVYDELEGIGAADHTSKLLNRVIEKSTDLEDIVAGSKEAYETKSSTRAKKLEQRMKSSENDAYKQELLKKYGKK